MALPGSGAISLSQVNTELGLAATTAISLNQTNVRNLAGVASGQISMSNLHGKSSLWTLDFGTNNYTDLNLRSVGDAWGFNGTQKKIKFRFAGYIDASSTAVPAIEIGSWPSDVNIELEIYGGQVRGRGGIGGNGQAAGGTAAVAGGAGGPAIKATYAVAGGLTITLNGGSVAAGGGGGGGGARGYVGGENNTYYAGGKGGNGWSVGVAQTAGTTPPATGSPGKGGNGGGSGGAGGAGTSTSYGSGAGGGAGGAAMVNSSYATKVNWVAGSNYFGALA